MRLEGGKSPGCRGRAARLIALYEAIAFAASSKPPIGPWHRAPIDPIVSPRGAAWEAAGTFNPAVLWRSGKFVMLYRAQETAGTSRLGYAESTDGIRFTRRNQPVFTPETPYRMEAWKTRDWSSSGARII